MAFLRFTYTDNPQDDDDHLVCYCDFCIAEYRSCDLREGLRPYWVRGVQLREGTKVTIALAKQATKIMMDRLEEIHQPLSLQTQAAFAICHRVKKVTAVQELPLPKALIDHLTRGEYQDEVGGSMAEDDEFNNIAKIIPGFLWKHKGAKVIRTTRHPYYRF